MKKSKHAIRINDEFDAMLYLMECDHDGETFHVGTAIVTHDFHRWVGGQIREGVFKGNLCIAFEDDRMGIAHVNRVLPLEEGGSKIVMVFQGISQLNPQGELDGSHP